MITPGPSTNGSLDLRLGIWYNEASDQGFLTEEAWKTWTYSSSKSCSLF